MKFKKLTAVGAGIALAIGSVFGVSLAASAADVSVSDITVEGTSYPAGAWFQGNPVTPGALTQDTAGLHITGQTQLLYGESMTGLTGTTFTQFVAGASFAGTGTMTFQIPVFFDGPGKLDFTTLRPVATGSPTTTGDWISSRAVAGLPAQTPVPFATIAAAFDTAVAPELLAFGVFVNPGDSAVLQTLTAGGNSWNFATPTPAVAPTPIKKAATFTG